MHLDCSFIVAMAGSEETGFLIPDCNVLGAVHSSLRKCSSGLNSGNSAYIDLNSPAVGSHDFHPGDRWDVGEFCLDEMVEFWLQKQKLLRFSAQQR